MKKVFSVFIGAVLLAMTSLTVTSCFKNDESYTRASYAYATVGKVDSKTVLYSDGGPLIYPTQSSISDITDGKGFSSNRVFVYFNYEDSNVIQPESNNRYIINDVKLTAGRYLDKEKIMSIAEAEAANITCSDSTYHFTSLTNMWVYRGFLTITGQGGFVVQGGYAILPTITLVYDPSDVKENEIKMTALYNRHASSPSSLNYDEYDIISTFDMTKLASVIPGTDSVTVSVTAPEIATKVFKFGREDFSYPEGIVAN